jgi:hypothetical protein
MTGLKQLFSLSIFISEQFRSWIFEIFTDNVVCEQTGSTAFLENYCYLWTNWTCSTVLLENHCYLWTKWTRSTVLIDNHCYLWTNWTCSRVLENHCYLWTNWTCSRVLLENHCNLWTNWTCSKSFYRTIVICESTEHVVQSFSSTTVSCGPTNYAV